MNYRHAFHAGNFADVFKHAVVTRVLVHLKEKVSAFRVIDTHAGAGLYDLAGPEARRTLEWKSGIGRLRSVTLAEPIRSLLSPYLDIVAALNTDGDLRRYPGSPTLALRLLRPQDRLLASELEPKTAAILRRSIGADKRASVVEIDGWTALNAYIPPIERRGLVIVDPAYEDRDEFARLAEELSERRHCRAEVYEIHAAIIIDMRRLDQPALGLAKSFGIAVGIGNSDQLAAVVVGPAMIEAHERAGITGVGAANQRAAMQAGIDEHSHFAVAAMRHEKRAAGNRAADVIARLGHLGFMSDVQPGAIEDEFALKLQDLRRSHRRTVNAESRVFGVLDDKITQIHQASPGIEQLTIAPLTCVNKCKASVY